MDKLILASKSPRRKELLEKLGLEFDVVGSSYEEDMTLDMRTKDLAKYLSKGKAEEVAGKYFDEIVIAADTFVCLDEQILGKPLSVGRAREMLKLIRGKKVSVVTGFTVIQKSKKRIIQDVEQAFVYMRNYSDRDIEGYIKTGEPIDKAGAFAIQDRGGVLVDKIEGDFFTAVGLPIFKLVKVLKDFGITFWEF